MRREESMSHLRYDLRPFGLDGVVHAGHALLLHEALQVRMMAGAIEHQEAAAARADDLAAEAVEALAHLVVDLVDLSEGDLSGELLRVLPVLVEHLAPGVVVRG